MMSKQVDYWGRPIRGEVVELAAEDSGRGINGLSPSMIIIDDPITDEAVEFPKIKRGGAIDLPAQIAKDTDEAEPAHGTYAWLKTRDPDEVIYSPEWPGNVPMGTAGSMVEFVDRANARARLKLAPTVTCNASVSAATEKRTLTDGDIGAIVRVDIKGIPLLAKVAEIGPGATGTGGRIHTVVKLVDVFDRCHISVVPASTEAEIVLSAPESVVADNELARVIKESGKLAAAKTCSGGCSGCAPMKAPKCNGDCRECSLESACEGAYNPKAKVVERELPCTCESPASGDDPACQWCAARKAKDAARVNRYKMRN